MVNVNMRPFVTWHSLHCEYGNGSWAVIDGLLTVRTANGSKTTQLGGMSPESLAQILMWELAAEPQSEVA